MNTWLSKASGLFAVASLLTITGVAESAALDTPAISAMESGKAKIELTVTAGATGAPGGFTVWWMTESDFLANGSAWPQTFTGVVTEASFTGTPVVNVYEGMPANFQLGPNEAINIQVGDLFDETGVTASDYSELAPGEMYVFCVFANADGAWDQSGNSQTLVAGTNDGDDDCHHTIGYWKNHTEVWPGVGLTLGTVNYTMAEVLSILNQPSGGNGLVILGHQLIAAKLNILVLGADPSPVAATIAAADALIGSNVIPPVGSDSVPPASVSAMSEHLDDFNNDLLGTGCVSTATENTNWGQLKELFR